MYFCTAVDVPLFRPALLQWFNEDVISPGSLTVISSLNLAWLTLYRLEDSAWELNSTSGGQFKMSLLCLIIILFFNYLKKKKLRQIQHGSHHDPTERPVIIQMWKLKGRTGQHWRSRRIDKNIFFFMVVLLLLFCPEPFFDVLHLIPRST